MTYFNVTASVPTWLYGKLLEVYSNLPKPGPDERPLNMGDAVVMILRNYFEGER